MGEENANGPARVHGGLDSMTALLTKHCVPPLTLPSSSKGFSASSNAFCRLLRISPPAEPCCSPPVPGATLAGKGAFLPKAALWPCSWLCFSCHPGEASLCLAILLLDSENRGSDRGWKESVVCVQCGCAHACIHTHSVLAEKVGSICLPLKCHVSCWLNLAWWTLQIAAKIDWTGKLLRLFGSCSRGISSWQH